MNFSARFALAIVGVAYAFSSACGNESPGPLKPAGVFGHHMVLQRDMPVPVWGTAPAGAQVRVSFGGQTKEIAADAAGKWRVTLDKLATSSEPQVLTIEDKDQKVTIEDVLVGEVWIASGQSNMEWPVRMAADPDKEAAAANWPLIRSLQVPNVASDKPLEDIESPGWQICTPQTAPKFSAVGYYFARELYTHLKIPVGVIAADWGGTPMEAWTSREAMASVPTFADDYDQAKALLAKKNDKGQPMFWSAAVPSYLFNGMVAPIIPYAFRGVIWYQGESNAPRAAEYHALSELMITDWRKRWGEGDFPFLLVQLAGWTPGGDSWPLLREAQFKTLELPNVGMATAIDIGDTADIHPKNKQEVGRRLARIARAMAYGESIDYSGPAYKSTKVDGAKLRLSFDHLGGGLDVHGDKLAGFEIAGGDGKFVPATASIDGDEVVLSAEGVEQPQSARYDWAPFPAGNLYNEAGLPAIPFRTAQ